MNTIPVELKTEQPHVYTGVYQHDYGQILQIHGKNLPAVAEVQFSLQDQGGQTETRVGVTTNDVLEVQVPDKMLKNERVTENYCIFAYLYITDGKSGNTECKITIHVTSRPAPGEVGEDPDESHILDEAVNAVNAAAERAEQAEQNAKASAIEAGKYAASASESATAAEKKKKDALREVGEKKQEAIEAIQEQEETSVGKIVNHTDNEIKRIQNQTADSKAGLEQTITNADTSKGELDHSIETAGTSKTALDKSVGLAGTAKTELDTSIRKAGEAKTALDGSARTADETQETLSATVKQAGTLDASLNEKIETGTQLKTDLTVSGEKAVQDIQTAGSEQMGKMQAVAEEFTADREQIATNKEDIGSLKEDLGKCITIDDRGKVSEKTTTFFDIESSNNIFDYEEIETGLLSPDGVLASEYTNFQTSDFIKCREGTAYVCGLNGSEIKVNRICFFDYALNFLASETSVSKFVTPKRTRYIRCSICPDFGTTFQIEEGNTPTKYLPKGYMLNKGIKEGSIPNIVERFKKIEDLHSYMLSPVFNFFDKNADGVEIGCYYTNGERIENSNFAESDYIKVQANKKYCTGNAYQGVEVYDVNKTYLVSINGNKQGMFTIPPEGVYIRVNMSVLYTTLGTPFHILSYMLVEGEIYPSEYIPYGINYNLPLNTQNIKNLEKPLFEKKIMFFGDSITAGEPNIIEPEKSTFYAPKLIHKTGMILYGNYGVWGACWQHDSTTMPDGDTDTLNTIPNQVFKAIAEHINGTLSGEPDIIVLSAGTNNLNPNTDADVTLRSQFISDNGFLPVDGCNLNSIYGSIRWSYEKLHEEFPNAQIFLATPIQAWESTRYVEWIEIIADRIIAIASRLSCGVIDAYRKSGIYGRYEVKQGMGECLRDGLHPNEHGSELMAECYRLAIEQQFKVLN